MHDESETSQRRARTPWRSILITSLWELPSGACSTGQRVGGPVVDHNTCTDRRAPRACTHARNPLCTHPARVTALPVWLSAAPNTKCLCRMKAAATPASCVHTGAQRHSSPDGCTHCTLYGLPGVDHCPTQLLSTHALWGTQAGRGDSRQIGLPQMKHMPGHVVKLKVYDMQACTRAHTRTCTRTHTHMHTHTLCGTHKGHQARQPPSGHWLNFRVALPHARQATAHTPLTRRAALLPPPLLLPSTPTAQSGSHPGQASSMAVP